MRPFITPSPKRLKKKAPTFGGMITPRSASLAARITRPKITAKSLISLMSGLKAAPPTPSWLEIRKPCPDYAGVDQIDLYLEGSDQHRGWFHSSLLESCGTNGAAPYKAVLTHGFVLDEKGYKMSKSLGNVVDPLKMMEQYGADILRLWVMLSDYSEDIRIGKDTIKMTGDLYRRIRNTLRFLLGALDGFTAEEAVTDHTKMPELEQLMLHRLHVMDAQVRGHIENYEFQKLAKLLHDFCNEDLSAFYFDIRKDSLYCDAPGSDKRRACRTVLVEGVLLPDRMARSDPIFTAEEARATDRKDSSAMRPASICGNTRRYRRNGKTKRWLVNGLPCARCATPSLRLWSRTAPINPSAPRLRPRQSSMWAAAMPRRLKA